MIKKHGNIGVAMDSEISKLFLEIFRAVSKVSIIALIAHLRSGSIGSLA